MQAILHIGIHKTGSSAVQTFLQRNAAALNDKGFFYEPTLPDWPNHNPLADAFRISRDFALGEQVLGELMERTGERILLISSEMLCEPRIDANHILDFMGGWKKKVIAYVRHPCDMVIAAFSEQVKYFPNMYVRDINEHPLAYDPAQLDVLQHWLERDDIELILAPYDRRQWPENSLFLDFIQTIGISPQGLDMTDIRVNESISFTSTEILRQSLMSGISAEDFEALKVEVGESDTKDDRYPLTTETIAFCYQRMRETIELYRPFFRPGFKEDYLFESRQWR